MEVSAVPKTVTPVAEVLTMSEDFTFTGEIAVTKLEILLDSGAKLSILGKQAMDKIDKKFKIKPAVYRQIVAANKTCTEILGVAKENVKIGNFKSQLDHSRSKFHGRDFIKAHIESINFNTRTVNFKDENGKSFLATINSSEPHNKRFPLESGARVAKRVTIPANSKVIVEIYPSNNIIGGRAIV